MTTEERVLVEDLLMEYKSLVDYIKQPPREQFYNIPEVERREAKIDGIRQSLASVIKCNLHERITS